MYLLIKRLLDIAVSLIAIILLLPIFIPIIIILRLTAEGEVFYFQERIGLNNSRFQIWKFATMLKNSMSMGTGSITLQNDFRVTSIGKFLRKTKINELERVNDSLQAQVDSTHTQIAKLDSIAEGYKLQIQEDKVKLANLQAKADTYKQKYNEKNNRISGLTGNALVSEFTNSFQ
mgnify:CR=1 FL=1